MSTIDVFSLKSPAFIIKSIVALIWNFHNTQEPVMRVFLFYYALYQSFSR